MTDFVAVDAILARCVVCQDKYSLDRKIYEFELDAFQSELDAELSRLEECQLFNEAALVLATVSDDSLSKVLTDITLIVNSALARLFPDQNKHIELTPSIYQDKYSHINPTLYLNNMAIDIELQEGTGLAQVVSLLFVFMLVLARDGRKFLWLDEVIHGLHESVIPVMKELLEVFAKLGFQIVLIEQKALLSDAVKSVA